MRSARTANGYSRRSETPGGLYASAQYKHQGARENAITSLFDVTPTSFYQRINQLLDLETALAWNPMLVNRLRARWSSRRRRASRHGALM